MEKRILGLLDRAKADNKTDRYGFLILLGICLFIFLCNFLHIYNVVTGPHAVESVDVMKPGIKRNVIVEGPLRLFGSRKVTKECGLEREEGIYYISATSNATFLIFSEKQEEAPVSGRLKRFSREEAKTLPKSERISRWYVDAGQGKWHDSNLFMLVTVPIFFVLLPMCFMSFYSKPMDHLSKKLAEWGDTDTLIREIDADMNRHPERVTDKCFFSNDWAILFLGLRILRPQDFRSISLSVNEANKKVLKVDFHLVDGKDHSLKIEHDEEGIEILDTLLNTYRDKCTPAMKTLVRRLKQQQE